MSSTVDAREALIRRPVMSNVIFGMLIFVFTEIMFFGALVSSILVVKGGADSWLPPAGVRLPVVATAFNTTVLFLSGLFIYLAGREFKTKPGHGKVLNYTLRAIALGGFFVVFQGYEWLQLFSYGMTMTTGIFSAMFFLVIGTHGLHAIAGVLALVYSYIKIKKGKFGIEQITALQIFWYMVVGIWPILYGMLYF